MLTLNGKLFHGMSTFKWMGTDLYLRSVCVWTTAGRNVLLHIVFCSCKCYLTLYFLQQYLMATERCKIFRSCEAIEQKWNTPPPPLCIFLWKNVDLGANRNTCNTFLHIKPTTFFGLTTQNALFVTS